LTTLVGAALATLVSSCQLCTLKDGGGGDDCPGKARVCENPTVRALAQDLDELERHTERFGSVVIQQPSVWGQARLTRHREQFEDQMAAELTNFHATLQGSLWRSDQAYFTEAFALQAAISGGTGGAGTGSKVTVNNGTAASAAVPAGGVLASDIPTDAFGAFAGITRTPVTPPTALPFVDQTGTKIAGIALEPTVYLDQKARFLNHLNELRRINEGDDTADSPGYALNLVRIPVSVLPGNRTDKGHGAEVTMTLKPYLSDELLPTTFRNLVMNDLIDEIGVPLTELLNEEDIRIYFELKIMELEKTDVSQSSVTLHVNPCLNEKINTMINQAQKKEESKPPKDGEKRQDIRMVAQQNVRQLVSTRVQNRLNKPTVRIPSTRLRNAKRPIPPSQLIDVYGFPEAEQLAFIVYQTLRKDIPNKYWIHYPDVQGYLQEELSGAQKFLADPANADLWASFCTPDLVSAIRTRNVNAISLLRSQFEHAVEQRINHPFLCDITAILAWVCLVDSALLNDRLIQDMREAAAARGCPCLPAEPLPYFLPNPPPAARQAFSDYVRCRWPIHVFALDPVSEQQNIADVFSMRREMQLAMSLAFLNGQISARNMMRYARRIELDAETIALNHTAVGFSHGNETFGWRFYPRFQTPDIESNAVVLFRDLLWGGPNRKTLLHQRQLEPGIRECVAIVIMPSFVPYATLDVSSNWFSLTHPKHKLMTSTDTVKLSAQVKAIEDCSGHIGDAECYRCGDLERLIERARQLEARLPLQSTTVQIPYENTLGGFAMFNSGVTDLAPELLGWYGAPGVNLDAPTSMFLIGNHFSVHQTRIVAGGKEVTDKEMLSRQVMRVTIPAGAVARERDCGTFKECPPTPPPSGDQASADAMSVHELFVDVHVATPYGVTSHMLIPACSVKAAGGQAGGQGVPAGLAWVTDKLELAYVYKGLSIAASDPPRIRPQELKVDLSKIPPGTGKTVALTLTVEGPSGKAQIPLGEFSLADPKKALTIPASAVKTFVDQVFDKIGSQFGPEVNNPPVPVKVSQTDVLLKADGLTIHTYQLANPLTISWVKAP
jgi:hypothetical protein